MQQSDSCISKIFVLEVCVEIFGHVCGIILQKEVVSWVR